MCHTIRKDNFRAQNQVKAHKCIAELPCQVGMSCILYTEIFHFLESSEIVTNIHYKINLLTE